MKPPPHVERRRVRNEPVSRGLQPHPLTKEKSPVCGTPEEDPTVGQVIAKLGQRPPPGTTNVPSHLTNEKKMSVNAKSNGKKEMKRNTSGATNLAK